MSTDVYKLDQNAKGLPSLSPKDMGLLETYRYLMEEISDPRVRNWPLMSNPFPVMAILAIYLIFVTHLGPSFMKNRKPYSLQNFMILYNVVIASASAIICYGLLTSGWTTTISLGCSPMNFSTDPEPMSLARWVWWTLIIKICELGDTVIFVLRKKFNQTSILHIYHHASTAMLTWVVCKYVPGGMWTFIMMPNHAIHVVMYGYYLLAGLGSDIQRKIAPFKRYVTCLQLVQFVVMIIHTTQAFSPWCDPKRLPMAFIYMGQEILIFAMFIDFYRKTYLRKKAE